MPDKDYHLEHALHNNEALKIMDKSPKHLDWVITMSFYTCLHIVKYKIFPLKRKAANAGNFTLKTFEDYCSHFRSMKGSLHDKLADLVNEECPEIGAEYCQLKDMCQTARYNDYRTDREMSNWAKGLKKYVMDHCYKSS